MPRMITALAGAVLLVVPGCGEGDRPPPAPVDCSVEEAYEFSLLAPFIGDESAWYSYGDNTPGGEPVTVEEPDDEADGGVAELDTAVPVVVLPEPGRCGETRAMKIKAHGHNFWGTGFASWGFDTDRQDGTGYEGISLWVRSAPNTVKDFVLQVDDGRTVKLDGGDPGGIMPGTSCRLPPPDDLGEAPCYNGGVDAPSAATRVPAPDECGNSFHTVIRTTDKWQLVTIPWDELVQWPCPNRLEGGIDRTDIAKFEIELEQGTNYEILIDNIAFYRRRGGGGS